MTATYNYRRYKLPSGSVVEIRRSVPREEVEVAVRYVYPNGDLASSEFDLTLRFLLARCREVERV